MRREMERYTKEANGCLWWDYVWLLDSKLIRYAALVCCVCNKCVTVVLFGFSVSSARREG